MHDIVSNTADLLIIMFFGSIMVACFMNVFYYLFVGNGE